MMFWLGFTDAEFTARCTQQRRSKGDRVSLKNSATFSLPPYAVESPKTAQQTVLPATR
ncbi:hypothetical protein NDI44_00400 [Trichocoleus sp. DQ-A3]|uniref:hypothetical protein n=1 Tax=Cyanophyceae TaxID=3028117 RepID=UPI001682363C|nr:hypothetical protein [Coleofasciculus sp. FACHB-125]MBD1898429.1 hypothetical protein [Coleofasciculus sp. FACHB-125]